MHRLRAARHPPSDVPAAGDYSQSLAVADALAVLDELDLPSAHVVGLSMGAFCALHLAMRQRERVRSLVLASCRYGAHPEARDTFRADCDAMANALETA